MRALTLAIALAASVALFATGAQAQIYKSVDEQGRVTYSDTPPPDSDSEAVDLQPTNTTPSTPVPTRSPAQPETEQPAASAPKVAITAPGNESTIPMGGGIFDVAASVTPTLSAGQTLQLHIDGEPWGEPQASGSWHLENIFRGAHDLSVTLLNAAGEAVTQSESVRVYVLRPSIQ
ncbi:DUF4124 domain-containing protein [Mangrovimicrobium sediminis]|nr:DUF4124 domain-containing protein [Haliea sp. SAOS-164]